MDAKEAIGRAKAYLEELFGNEMMAEPRLEEIWLDRTNAVWCVTFGFFRKPEDVLKSAGTYATYVYKVVQVDRATGEPKSIRNRDNIDA
ncbi:MAG: hypothetical protein AB7O57_18450 [Hyphomicrobiaceae bacterium]